MSDEIEEFKNLWRNAKNKEQGTFSSAEEIIAVARQKMRSTIRLQWGTILILLITMIGISAFFINVAPFRETLSHVGSSFMVGGLAVRIAVELYSVYLSKTIDATAPTLKASAASVEYYRFRKTVNGPLTMCILALYTIGFYLLTPEFSSYIPKPALIMIHVSYVLGAVVVGYFIRSTIKKEMTTLSDVLRIHKDISKSD